MHILTKSKIISGLQCQKKLWFDVNEPIKQDLHVFYIGNRFGDFARKHYGQGLDLTNNHDVDSVLHQTSVAMNDPNVKVIYEAAFQLDETLIRSDVLLRNDSRWEMIEVKSSTSVKPEHIKDAAIQASVIESQGIDLSRVKIAYINNDFIYKGNGGYDNFLVEKDVTEAVRDIQKNVALWIKVLKPLGIMGSSTPIVAMGEQCTEPYICAYHSRCKDLLPKSEGVPISILPNVGKKLAIIWEAKGVHDLRDIPTEALPKPIHRTIQNAHKTNTTWIDPKLMAQINAYPWPRFFMDFETVQQGVPLIPETKPYDALPFQWSVHRWDYQEQEVKLEDGEGYLEFLNNEMARNFLVTLFKSVGSEGPIFAHNASFERSKLLWLSNRSDCLDLKPHVKLLVERIVDTLELTRNGFYSPVMNGSFSIKDIVKAIPTNVDYNSLDGLSGGDQAQVAWFKCTDPDTPQVNKNKWVSRLKKYCAQDTLAMYHLVRFLGNSDHVSLSS